jgi:hypothetical protein
MFSQCLVASSRRFPACNCGLEEKKDANGNEIGVRNDALDRDRWNWMQRYRVWEANRKVFLYHQIAEDIRKAIRARFDEDVWEQVVKPLNDQLREHQKQALIAYLLVQPDLIRWGVIDADSLFEFFLIDVQMDS